MGARKPREVHAGDRIFAGGLRVFAAALLALLGLIVAYLAVQSTPAFRKFGVGFLFSSQWDPVAESFGAWPAIFGTVVSSAIAIVLATPLSIGVGLFLTELAPPRAARIVGFLVQMLAAIPSVVFGLWGIFVLAPWLRTTAEPVLGSTLGWLPLFQGPPYGVGMLAAGIILAIMITPTISAIAVEVFRAVPTPQREAALALAATRWETMRIAVLGASRSGVFGAATLGLGRALGETMAVTMVIGNRAEASASLFAPAQTMASVIANEYAEATGDLHLSSLAAIGLALFAVTFVLGLAARVLVWRAFSEIAGCDFAKRAPSRPRGGRRGSAGSDNNKMTSRLFAENAAYFERAYRRRKLVSWLASLALIAAAALALAPLFSVFRYVLQQGLPGLAPGFFTELPKPVGEPGGGMANAVAGTVVLVGLASAFGIPWGIAVGIFLSEYSSSRLGKTVRFVADTLASVPSILIGLFAYAVVVVPMRRFSAIAGGVALAVLMVPIVARSAEEILKLVPTHIREAGLALGLPRWKVTLRIVLRSSLGGLATGVILAIARVAGETAPLLFTALGSRFWPTRLDEPIASLPVQIYAYAISPYDEWHRQAWTGALVLVLLVVTVNLGARVALGALGRQARYRAVSRSGAATASTCAATTLAVAVPSKGGKE